MSIINEKYSASRINLLHQMLVNDTSQGKPRDYEIKVDELKVVQRTNDPEHFFQHEDFVQPDTQSIIISIFDGASRKCTKYQLHLNETFQKASAPSLDGIENTIKEKISLERRQWDFEQLQKKCAELEGQLQEAEDYHDELQKQIEELQNKKLNLKDHFGDIASRALEGLLARNTHLLGKIPGLGGLAGVLEQSKEQNPVENSSENVKEANASFAKKTTQSQSANLSEEEQRLLKFAKDFQASFSENDTPKVIQILRFLSAEPKKINTVLELLHDEAEADVSSSPDVENHDLEDADELRTANV